MAHPVKWRVPVLANHFRQNDEDPYRQARPGRWPVAEPDSAVRDMTACAIAIGFWLLIVWGSGGLNR